MNHEQPHGPWIGLRAYTAEDREYFYGREDDVRIVASNLRARRLTVIYGSTGIGKSSLLRAGVVPNVQSKQPVVLFDEWQSPLFLEELKRRCFELAPDAGNGFDPKLPLDELLAATAAARGAPVLVVFDQFEEYFVAHPADDAGFEPELARSVNRSDVHGGFLISLREDALAGMDRFQLRIPNLLRNLIRIEYLTQSAASDAVQASLDAWNTKHHTAVDIEDALLARLVRDVGPAQRASLVGATGMETPTDAVEAPLLQLVLGRLWAVERLSTAGTLRLRTYEALGCAEGIVAHHFAEILERLTLPQQEACARFFDRLITPSGGKISYPIADLDDVAQDLASEVPSALQVLKEARILREIDTGGQRAVEIYHDVLAPTILDWHRQIVQGRERAEERRRRRRWFATAAFVLAAILGGIAYVNYSNWVATRPWGTFTDLLSGRGYRLRGPQIIVGRNALGQKADVSFANHLVSRAHLLLNRNGRASDLRSLNGTTVDGRFVKYGQGTIPVHPGDIVVVAGVGILRFERVGYPFWHIWTPAAPKERPATGSAMLITGRHARPVPRGITYLSLEDGDIVASSSPAPTAVAAIRVSAAGVEVADLRDGKPNSIQCPLPNGEAYPITHLRNGGVPDILPPNCVLLVRDRPVQVVPIPATSS